MGYEAHSIEPSGHFDQLLGDLIEPSGDLIELSGHSILVPGHLQEGKVI